MSVRRVVITGVGLVTPLGVNTESSWLNLVEGKSGIKRIVDFDTNNFPCKIAGLINSKSNDFCIEDFINARDIKKMDLFIQYGIVAATEAINDSGWVPKSEKECDRTGVMIGSGIGGLKCIEETSVMFHESQRTKVSPFFIPASLINLLSGHVSIKFNFSGPNHAVATACSTGAHAIGDAARIIKCNEADVMVAGGSEAPITPVGLAGFISARALSTKYNDFPEEASRPWDQGRDGFVMGEGSGVVVLEEYEHAMKRKANIYAEIVGYSSTGDAYHITSPHPEGRGAFKAMTNAINDAKIDVSQIDYINAHSTSTPLGDAVELNVVQRIFLDKNPKVLMSSTKSAVGHMLGAAGSVELIFSILSIRDQIVPPTLNLHNPIDEVVLDLVPFQARNSKIEFVISNSFGFGGTNSSIVIKKVY